MKAVLSFILLTGSMLFIATAWNSVDMESGGMEIEFRKISLEQALLQAKAEKKVIFVDVYAPWCGPCKWLKKTTFSDPAVGKRFNENFINIAIDGERKNAKELMERHQITSFPTMLFIRPDGNEIRKLVGYRSTDELLIISGQVLATR
jgi:thioredoxin 1